MKITHNWMNLTQPFFCITLPSWPLMKCSHRWWRWKMCFPFAQLFFDFSIGHNHRLQKKALATLEPPPNVRISLCKQTTVYLRGGLTVATFEVGFVATPALQEGTGAECYNRGRRIPAMQSTAPNGARVAKVVETEQDVARLHKHLKEVIEGEAFKGSHRSGQFLTYIVEESIAGRFAALKERVIGVKLFGRDPSYDTGEDAIVRVTASDVRRRLLQHYGKYGFTSEFRISLPLGSYIPEITREPQKTARRSQSPCHPRASGCGSRTGHCSACRWAYRNSGPDSSPRNKMVVFRCPDHRVQRSFVGNLLEPFSRPGSTPVSILPWPAFFQSPRSTKLITSDPNIVEIQEVTGSTVSLSDYANQRFIPNVVRSRPR